MVFVLKKVKKNNWIEAFYAVFDLRTIKKPIFPIRYDMTLLWWNAYVTNNITRVQSFTRYTIVKLVNCTLTVVLRFIYSQNLLNYDAYSAI